MRRSVVQACLLIYLSQQTLAVAGPHEDGVADGQASNPFQRGTVSSTSASDVVPGYTATPQERSFYGQPNLTGQVSQNLVNCDATPDDPVCEAKRTAIQSANGPRDAVTPADAQVAAGKAIARNPSLELGSLASFYSGCTTNDIATPAGTQTRICHRYTGVGNYQCTRTLTVGLNQNTSCNTGDWFASANAGGNSIGVQCLPDRPDTSQHFRITMPDGTNTYFDADLTLPRPTPQRIADLGIAPSSSPSGTPPHNWLWMADTSCNDTNCTATAMIAPERVEACEGSADGGRNCTTVEPFRPAYRACPSGQQQGGVIQRPSGGSTGGNTGGGTGGNTGGSTGVTTVIDYYGDSTVWGYASGTGDQVARPAPVVFAEALGSGFTVRNEGVSATTACQLLQGTDGRHPPWEQQMTTSNANYVIVNHAINDQWNNSVGEYRACLTQLAQIAKNHGKQIVFETPNPTRDSGPGGLDVVVQAMRDVAAAEHAPVIDQYAYLTEYLAGQSPTTLSPDGLHPSDAIYAMKGQYAASIFETIYAGGTPPATPSTTLDPSRCYIPSATPTAIAGTDTTGTFRETYWTQGGLRTANGWEVNPAYPRPVPQMTLNYAKPSSTQAEQDQWDDQCPTMADGGRCTLASADVCVDGPSTKRIDGRDVTRACWKYERTFTCAGTAPANDCSSLAAGGCSPNGSTCRQTNATTGVCEVYEDTYNCPTPAETVTTAANCPSNVFCVGENCFNISYAADADFARSMAYMEAAREAGVYLDPDRMQVFKGESNRCRDRLLRNCCRSNSAGSGMTNQSVFGVGSRLVYDVLMNSENRRFLYQGLNALLSGAGYSGSFSTFGVSVAVNGAPLPSGSVALANTETLTIGFDPWSLAVSVILYGVMSMMSCNEDEGKLAMKEGARLCRTIGNYCSSCIRVLGRCVSCIERTTSKCCFNSVLARLINEQGRAQVGKDWGTAENPDCSGFTVAQLQSLNIAAMDLTEFYASIVPKLPDVAAIRTANNTRASQLYANPKVYVSAPPATSRLPPAPGPVKPPGGNGGTGYPPPPTGNEMPYGQDPSQYVSTFAEEFQNGLDSALWNDTIWYEPSPSTRNYTVENGVLKIWPQQDANGAYFNRTIDTDGKYYQTYGYFEVEAKLPIGRGTWPAFWLFNHIGDRRPEIDVMEAYAGGVPPWGFIDDGGVPHPQAYSPTVWIDAGKRAGTRQYDSGMDLSTGFHKYAVRWEPNRQTFYFDGREVLSVNVSMGDPMYLMLDLWYGADSGQPNVAETPQGKSNSYEVNYVRAWRFR